MPSRTKGVTVTECGIRYHVRVSSQARIATRKQEIRVLDGSDITAQPRARPAFIRIEGQIDQPNIRHNDNSQHYQRDAHRSILPSRPLKRTPIRPTAGYPTLRQPRMAGSTAYPFAMDAGYDLPMKPRLAYDGDCAFCRYTVEYAASVTSDAVEYRPYQEVMSEYPDITEAEFADSIQLFADGERYERADAAFRTLAIGGVPLLEPSLPPPARFLRASPTPCTDGWPGTGDSV